MCAPAMRARNAAHGTLAALAVLALGACQEPDVGQPCQLDIFQAGLPIDVEGAGGQVCSDVAADYFRSGAIECDNLICIRSATGACGDAAIAAANPLAIRKFCSKACVSDRDCFSGETHLSCRQIVLDPVFIAGLPPDVRQKYLGAIQSSN